MRGDLSDWRRSASNVKLGKYVKNVDLLIDSTDFRLSGKKIPSKKSEDCSFKLDFPEQCFQFIQDLNG
jgi:hypothetical protein